MNSHIDVFVVQHVHALDCDGDEDVKFIGVYSTRDAAQEAVNRLKLKPGFCDTPDGFSIDLYKLDKDNWTGGYFTIQSSNDVEEGNTPTTDAGHE